MNRYLLVLLTLALAAAIGACGAESESDFSPVSVRLAGSGQDAGGSLGAEAIPSLVALIRVGASAEDLPQEIHAPDIVVTEGMWDLPYVQVSFDVPNGAARYFHANAFDSPGTIIYFGSYGPVDLTGEPVQVPILMSQQVP
jgi:hypothetical protein